MKNKQFFIYLSSFVLFYILAGAGVNGFIYPFAIGLFLALVWNGQKAYVLAPLFALSYFLNYFTLESVITSASLALFILLVSGLHYKFKKPIKLSLYYVYAILSQAGFVFFSVYYHGLIVSSFLNVVISVLFMQACSQFISALTVRGINARLSPIEIVSGCTMLLAVCCGLMRFNFYGFELIKLVASAMLLFSAYVLGFSGTLVVAITMGLGSLLYANNPVLIAPFAIWALVILAFKVKNKFLPALALLAAEAVLGFFIGVYYSYSWVGILPVAISALAFVCLPTKVFEKLNNNFLSLASNVAMRNVVNRSREGLCKRLNDLSSVFGEMDVVFRSMIRGGMAKEDAKEVFMRELKDKVCADCKERNMCHRMCYEDTKAVFGEMIDVSLERGKATLLDVPPYLSSRCSRVSNIVTTINGLSREYRGYAGLMGNVDNSKILIADQLSGISQIMKNLAGEVSRNVTFDAGKENSIIDELTYHNIICEDAVVYEQNADIVSATVVVKTEDAQNPKIASLVSKICGSKMVVASRDLSSKAGQTIVSLKTSPKFDIIFGTASATKEGSQVSGDCFSLVRIENDKFMMAICDGMGSGARAEHASSLAIGLIEDFYKAGFDNEIVLSSVNKLLMLNKEEVFSALDVCVVDLRKGIADFIKMGAPEGYIKHDGTISVVESGALPIGILQNVEPVISKKVLSVGDIVIICSDGIYDSFKSQKDFMDFANNLKPVNPQMIAEEIVEEALSRSGGVANDDMTVIACKVFAL